MTTVRDVVKLALQQARVVGIGREPKAAEYSVGLQAFQGMIDGWLASGMFGRLTDVYLEENETAEEGVRYLLATGVTVAPPTTVDDEDSGGQRPPYDLSVYETITSAGVRVAKLYDRTGWVDLLGLTLDSVAPLSGRDPIGLAASIALTYAEMFGASLGPQTTRRALLFSGMISGKAGTTQPKQPAEYY